MKGFTMRSISRQTANIRFVIEDKEKERIIRRIIRRNTSEMIGRKEDSLHC